MTRSELYDLVWTKPMMHVAEEFGLSGPGLAKLCERLGIPTPSRGHWAKLRAGKRSKQVPLPQPDLDVTVRLPSAAERRRRTEAKNFQDSLRAVGAEASSVASGDRSRAPSASGAAETGSPVPAVKIADVLEHPHPLVLATAVVVEQLPVQLARYERATPAQRAAASFKIPPLAHHARHALDVRGGLAMTASLGRMEWTLRFVDALLKGLIRAGVRIERSTRPGEHAATLQASMSGEVLEISPMVEGYRRQEIPASELAEILKTDKWASKWRYSAAGRFSFGVHGTEPMVRTGWSGPPEKLESLLPQIVAICVDLLKRQPGYRQAREVAQVERQREAERHAQIRRRAEARQKLLERALEAARQYEHELVLERFLAMIERDAGGFKDPYPERAKVWVSVVRQQLEEASPWRTTLGQMLTVQSWESWPPPWWPTSEGEST